MAGNDVKKLEKMKADLEAKIAAAVFRPSPKSSPVFEWQ